MEKTLKNLQTLVNPLSSSSLNIPSSLIGVLLGQEEPAVSTSIKKDDSQDTLQFFDMNLNTSQQEAVKFVLNQTQEVGLIHGPPG